jgi:hypothetical protein
MKMLLIMLSILKENMNILELKFSNSDIYEDIDVNTNNVCLFL